MHSYAKLAKKTAESYVRTQQISPSLDPLLSELQHQQACYVYLFENPGRRLRALYGQPLPRYATLGQEIVANVVAALTTKGRAPLRRPELASMVYTVAVLDPPQRISDAVQLDPHNFGLYIQSDQGKSAVLLPKRTGIDTPQDQIATALRESGINTRHETVRMYRFGVTYYD